MPAPYTGSTALVEAPPLMTDTPPVGAAVLMASWAEPTVAGVITAPPAVTPAAPTPVATAPLLLAAAPDAPAFVMGAPFLVTCPPGPMVMGLPLLMGDPDPA